MILDKNDVSLSRGAIQIALTQLTKCRQASRVPYQQVLQAQHSQDFLLSYAVAH
jgi:hypothetical protein